jgi:hypothetical protein
MSTSCNSDVNICQHRRAGSERSFCTRDRGAGHRPGAPCSGNPSARWTTRWEFPMPGLRWRRKVSPSQVLRVSRTSIFAWDPAGGMDMSAQPFLILSGT